MWWILGLALSGPLLLVGTWVAINAWAMHHLEKSREAFRQHGYPMSLDEVLPQPAANEENAALLISAAWAIVVDNNRADDAEPAGAFASLSSLPMPPGGDDLVWRCTDEELEAMRAFASKPEVLNVCAVVREAAKRPAFVPDVDYRQGYAVTLPYVGQIRSLARILAISALAEATMPASESRAWQNVAAIFALADHVGKCPTMIDGLAGVVLGQMACVTLNRLIETARPSIDLHEGTAWLANRLEHHQGAFARGCHFERLGGVSPLEAKMFSAGADWIDLIEKLSDTPPASRLPRPVRLIANRAGRPYLAWDFKQTYDAFLSANLAAEESGVTAKAKWAEFTRRRDNTRTLVSAVLVPTVHRFYTAHRTHETKIKLSLVALQSLLFRDRTGAWPRDVAILNLATSTTLDRCSGQQIVLQPEEDALLVYALGFDGIDDAERPVDPESVAGSGGIVLRLQVETPED